MTGSAGKTLNVTWLVPVPMRFTPPTVATEVPAASGIPLITPDAVSNVSPEGRPLAVKRVGALLAETV